MEKNLSHWCFSFTKNEYVDISPVTFLLFTPPVNNAVQFFFQSISLISHRINFG